MILLNNRIAFYEHYEDNTIQELELNNGRIIDQTVDILQGKKKFYENLYASKFQMGNIIHDPQYKKEFFPQSQGVPRILKEDRDNLGKPIAQEEMLQALKGMQNDKSLGQDGFPAELYKFFRQDIKNYLFNSYMTSLDKGILSISQCRGVITLIPKQGKNIKNILN